MSPVQPRVPSAGCQEQQLSWRTGTPQVFPWSVHKECEAWCADFQSSSARIISYSFRSFLCRIKGQSLWKTIKFLTRGSTKAWSLLHFSCRGEEALLSNFYSRPICGSDYNKSGASDFFSISQAQKVFRNMFQKRRNLLKNRGRKAVARGTCGGTECQSQAKIRFFICPPGRPSEHPDFSNTWRGLSDTYRRKESSKNDKSSENKGSSEDKFCLEDAPTCCRWLIAA